MIAGRITDEFGEPVAQAQVSAQRYQYGPDGQRRLTVSGSPITTDDLGQFRLHSLMPGEYVVTANFRGGVSIGGLPGSDTSEGFLPTFYPGTVNASDAQPVTVTLGQESSVQFALSAARMARVSGLVVDSTGRALASAMVVLLPSSGLLSVSGLTSSQTGPDGSFTFANVAPGDYVANVQLVPGLSANANIGESAAVPVSVGGSNLNGLRIATGSGVLISGHVEFEGTSPRTAQTPWRVMTQSVVPAQVTFSGGNAQANGLVGEDGSFQLQVSGVGGAVIRTTTTPQWTLKAVTLDGEDVTDTPLDFSGKGAVRGLRIVLTDKLTTVSGRVIDARGKPLTDYAVVIQPEEAKTGVIATRYLRVLRPDQNGGFRVTGLPPGSYAATAVETFEQGRQFVPEVQARLKARGRTFSIDEGGTAALDLSLATGVE